jgi:hypothetical protein
MSEWSYLEKLAIEGVERVMSGEVVLATPGEELGECLFERGVVHNQEAGADCSSRKNEPQFKLRTRISHETETGHRFTLING